MSFLLKTVRLFAKTIHKFINDRVPQMAAALSFYALFALPPILIITILFLRALYSSEVAQEALVQELSLVMGNGAIRPILEILDSLSKHGEPFDITQILGAVALLISATGILGHIQHSLNTILQLKPQKRFLLTALTQRLFALLFIAFAGVFLIISTFINNLIEFWSPLLQKSTGLGIGELGSINTLTSFLLSVLMIALAYRIIPSGKMHWKDISVGASVTALLFSFGKFLVSWYLGYVSIGSAYGAAGSILVLLFWIYYSSLIFFFGAEFTYMYSTTHGAGIKHKEENHD